jgi:hypothetical protein
MHIKIQRFGKGLQKRTATRGAGFIKNNTVDGAVFYLHALHILTADVEDKIDLGTEIFGTLIMGNGFNFADVNFQGFFDQTFTISGNR